MDKIWEVFIMLREKKMITRFLVILLAMVIAFAFSVTTADEVSAASKPAKVKITSIKSVNYNAIKVTWGKVKNAKKYQIYRATSKNGTYKRVITTSKLSITDKGLTTGKTYYYKVRAINGDKKGTFSLKKSAAPKLKKVTSVRVAVKSSSSAKISWAKVSGAKGYIVYRATTKNGEYKKVATTTTISYTNKKLTAEKTYYYKVKAYRTVGEKKKYSASSSIKSVKIPTYVLKKGEELSVANKTFNKTITVGGEAGRITFMNCKFKGDVVNRSSDAVIILFVGNCKIDGKCIFKNTIKEATLETQLPKFMSDSSIRVVADGCAGSAIALNKDMTITFNGKKCTLKNSDYFIDASNPNDMVIEEYTTQKANLFYVAQWWEDGERILFKACEYDPGM